MALDTSPLFLRNGQGTITGPDAAVRHYSFSLCHTKDRDVEVLCTPIDTEPLPASWGQSLWRWEDSPQSFTFAGKTSDGFQITLQHVWHVGYSGNVAEGKIGFSCAQAQLDRESQLHHDAPSHLRISLLNYEMLVFEVKEFKLPSGFNGKSEHISFKVRDRDVILQPMPDHYATVKQLEETRGIGVTCEALIPLLPDEDLQVAEGIGNQLCSVLSLLQTGRVSWVQSDLIASDGSVDHIVLQDAVCTPFSRQTLLNYLFRKKTAEQMSSHGYTPIIEKAMAKFPEMNVNWDLGRVINLFTTALSERDFIEQRGLKLVTCLEVVRESDLQHQGNAFIIPREIFDQHFREIQKEIKAILKSHFEQMPDLQLPKGAIDFMSTQARGLNRYPFRHLLKKLCEQIGLEDNNDVGFVLTATADATLVKPCSSIDAFVNLRDMLVHQGRFAVPGEDAFASWDRKKSIESSVVN